MEPWDQLKAKTGELLDDGLRSGTLTVEEHRWRRSHLERATEPHDLDVLVEDLLDPPREGVSASSSQVTVLSQRTLGFADLGRRAEVVNLLGSTRVDLREAGRQPVSIELVNVLGETVVEVPAGVGVRLNGTPVLGECFLDPQLRGPEPTVTINAVVLLGTLRVVRAGGKTISS